MFSSHITARSLFTVVCCANFFVTSVWVDKHKNIYTLDDNNWTTNGAWMELMVNGTISCMINGWCKVQQTTDNNNAPK